MVRSRACCCAQGEQEEKPTAKLRGGTGGPSGFSLGSDKILISSYRVGRVRKGGRGGKRRKKKKEEKRTEKKRRLRTSCAPRRWIGWLNKL
jgi:hypothetical protein